MNAVVVPAELQTSNPSIVFQCFEIPFDFGLGGTDDSVRLRAWYSVAFSSVYDRGRGRGDVIVHRVECDNSCTRDPLWEKVKLPDSMIEALEREIREEEGVIEGDEE